MILHIENPKDATRKLVELINEFSKVIGYRINTQKSFVFLYTNKEKSEKKIKEMIPFPLATKRIKHPGINYLKRQKTCMHKTIRHWWKKSKTTQKDGDISFSWIGKIKIVKMTIPPTAKYIFNAIITNTLLNEEMNLRKSKKWVYVDVKMLEANTINCWPYFPQRRIMGGK